MKRTAAKQRRFGPGEFAGMAKQCMDVIMRGQSVFDFLANKGIPDPVSEWYDIRRWIKSNAPSMYASLPTELRLEVPVKRVNQNTVKPSETPAVPEQEKEAETPPSETKRRAGRPPKVKDGETVMEEKKPRKVPHKVKPKVMINEVQGQKLTYTRQEGGAILFHIPGFDAHMALRVEEIQNMMGELPEVLRILGK